MGCNIAKQLVPAIKKQIEVLDKDRKAALNRPDLSEEDTKHISGVIRERIREIELRHHEKAKMTVQARDRLEGETIGPYLTSLNAEQQPREILHRLRIPDPEPPIYTTNLGRMTEIA